MPKIVLFHQTGPRKGEKEVFPTSRYSSLFVGRSADCDFCVDDPNCVVSRTHALIEWDDAPAPAVTITDLHSANGTYLNGERVEKPTSVSNGDAIQLGVRIGPIFRIAVISPRNEPEDPPVPHEERHTPFPDPRDPEREAERARSPATGTRNIVKND